MNDREEQLRQRAYRIWQSEGEPQGRDRDHWERAERELAEAVPDEPAAASKPAARRKATDSAPQTIAAESKPKAPRKTRAKTA